MILETKCNCGCNEKHFKIGFKNIYVFYFIDCGEWWIELKLFNTVYSYSPCQGFIKYKVGG